MTLSYDITHMLRIRVTKEGKQMIHTISHALLDTLKLVPFLFLTYLLMEYIEHKTSDRIEKALEKSKKSGPAAGGLLGMIPQCGFSSVAANFYSARMITLGTLAAVFISTSDEMLPIFIASSVAPSTIVKILLFKLTAAVIAGFLIDAVLKPPTSHDHHEDIHHLCEAQGCNCGGDNIFRSAAKHTLSISIFIFIVVLICSVLIAILGVDTLSDRFFGIPVLGEITASLIGIIPNCASSVMITQFYLEGIMPAGPMISGLMMNSGVGLAVLFRMNRNIKENLTITALIFILSVMAGIIVSILNISF